MLKMPFYTFSLAVNLIYTPKKECFKAIAKVFRVL